MADALAAVGIAASIIQLVDFGSRVIKRLAEYQTRLGSIPKAFVHVTAELPVLLDTLRQTGEAIDAGRLPDETKNALVPAVEGCKKQIELLDNVITKALPIESDSRARRSLKAVGSLRYEGKVEKINAIIQGYVRTLTYHAAASSAFKPSEDSVPSRPPPSSTVPFRRDPYFVDSDLKGLIERKSKRPAQRTALVGLGGVGKSQLAIELSYRVREKSPDTWVFWVHAGSSSRFEDGFRRIAERVKIPGHEAPGGDIWKIVRDWLSDESNGSWLMIIDNADDMGTFNNSSAPSQDAHKAVSPLLEYLPQSSNGSILVTSRNKEVAFRLVGDYQDIHQVDPMDERRALELLQKKLTVNCDQRHAEALVQALDYMPLSINQAAAYISQRAPRVTVSTYMRDLSEGGRTREKLLNADLGDIRRDGTSLNSVMSTWQISFESIRRERPSAARLLSLMSHFDRQGIPESILSGWYFEGDDMSRLESDHHSDGDDETLEFEDDINTLVSFSLVAIDKDGSTFEMHRLVQFSIRQWLKLHGETGLWEDRYVTLLHSAFQPDIHKVLENQLLLFPHVQAALMCQSLAKRPSIIWLKLLRVAAAFAVWVASGAIEEQILRTALEGYEAIYGLDDRNTLLCMHSLAKAYFSNNKYKEAEELAVRTIEIQTRVLGVGHEDTIGSIAILVKALKKQKRLKDAGDLESQVMQISKVILAAGDQASLNAMRPIALVLEEFGQFEESEEIYLRVLQVRKKVFGPNHSDTLESMDDLVCLYTRLRRWKEAEELSLKYVEIANDTLREENIRAIIGAVTLGRIYSGQDRFKEAEDVFALQLKRARKAIGDKNAFNLGIGLCLSEVIHSQGRTDEAISMTRECLKETKRVFGTEAWLVYSLLENLNKWTEGTFKISDF